MTTLIFGLFILHSYPRFCLKIIFINYPCRITNSYRIRWNVFCDYGSSTYLAPFTYRYAGQNGRIRTQMCIIPHFHRSDGKRLKIWVDRDILISMIYPLNRYMLAKENIISQLHRTNNDRPDTDM